MHELLSGRSIGGVERSCLQAYYAENNKQAEREDVGNPKSETENHANHTGPK